MWRWLGYFDPRGTRRYFDSVSRSNCLISMAREGAAPLQKVGKSQRISLLGLVQLFAYNK